VTTTATSRDAKAAANLRNYALVTGAYWADTLTDGALRMLVLLYFHQRGYSAIQVAMLFLFYEVFGIVTNLVGGWIAARLGLKTTLFAGLGTQLVALSMLTVNPSWLTVPYVMAAQALSGIAKDLTKMSSKSAVKLIVADDAQSTLFRWVAVLTGSKNALKGIGFFVGGLLLYLFDFRLCVLILAGLVLTALVTTAMRMRGSLGTANKKAKFRQMFSHNRARRRHEIRDAPQRSRLLARLGGWLGGGRNRCSAGASRLRAVPPRRSTFRHSVRPPRHRDVNQPQRRIRLRNRARRDRNRGKVTRRMAEGGGPRDAHCPEVSVR
jgi:hypothetical protein